MTRRELLDRRISASADALIAENLPAYCDIYRTSGNGKDSAGAVREGTRPVAQAIPCGVVPTDEPTEITVAGRVMGMADATIGLPIGVEVRETDEIHVRRKAIPGNALGSPAYLSEHQIFTVIGTSSIATHSHLLTVYVSRRR
jgi:hypothetical protein